ncbi:hypothetical protein C8R45DRAFT_1072991 [Mycena sanguinolenta]|nr:hypothetical protein C8R45DRAFT_1072991 [Mycena sanguinolenta]
MPLLSPAFFVLRPPRSFDHHVPLTNCYTVASALMYSNNIWVENQAPKVQMWMQQGADSNARGLPTRNNLKYLVASVALVAVAGALVALAAKLGSIEARVKLNLKNIFRLFLCFIQVRGLYASGDVKVVGSIPVSNIVYFDAKDESKFKLETNSEFVAAARPSTVSESRTSTSAQPPRKQLKLGPLKRWGVQYDGSAISAADYVKNYWDEFKEEHPDFCVQGIRLYNAKTVIWVWISIRLAIEAGEMTYRWRGLKMTLMRQDRTTQIGEPHAALDQIIRQAPHLDARSVQDAPPRIQKKLV